MSKGKGFGVRSGDALCAFQAVTRHSSLDEGIFAEKARKHEDTNGTRAIVHGGGNG